MFNTCRWFAGEAVNWRRDDKTGKAMKVDDHLVGSCFKLWAMGGARYYGSQWRAVVQDAERAEQLAARNAQTKVRPDGSVVLGKDVREKRKISWTGYT